MEEREQTGSLLGAAIGVVTTIGRGLASAFQAVVSDGALAAAGRQGVDEIGMALKAFPDSIQAREAKTIFDSLPGENAASREPDGPSPSDIARDDTPLQVDPNQTYSHELGRGR